MNWFLEKNVPAKNKSQVQVCPYATNVKNKTLKGCHETSWDVANINNEIYKTQQFTFNWITVQTCTKAISCIKDV